MFRAIVAMVMFGAGVGAIAAESHVMSVDSFTMVDVGQGIAATVICGRENSVTVNASEKEFDKMTLKAEGGVLKLSRGFSFGMVKSIGDKLAVTVTTENELTALETSAGSSLEVAGCAVDDDRLKATVKSGGDMIVGGSTDLLELEVGARGTFNAGFHASDLEVDHVILKISGGSEAGLCEAEKIEGKATTSAEILASPNAEMQIQTGTGAEVSNVGCKAG